MRSATDQRLKSRRRPMLAAALCAAVVLAGMAATPAPAAAEPLRIAQANGISLNEAISLVRERTGGQVLRAETKRDKGRTVHRIRVLTEDGRVRTWHVDADTGRMY